MAFCNFEQSQIFLGLALNRFITFFTFSESRHTLQNQEINDKDFLVEANLKRSRRKASEFNG